MRALILARREIHHDQGHTWRFRFYELLASLLGEDTLYDTRHQ